MYVMRTYRLKIDHADTWYHCYNHTIGTSADRPLGDADKEMFVRILHRVSMLYGVKVVGYQIMSNHFHLLIHAPVRSLQSIEMCNRYNRFHRGKRSLLPDSPLCDEWCRRSRDISWFMRHVQHLFTAWYNRTRPVKRKGSIWADRFKHTILESGSAVWSCWKYIENNSARAGMVKRAGDYRFCSFGVWFQTGRHPFEQNLIELILPMTGASSVRELMAIMTGELGEEIAQTQQGRPGECARRRLKYWTCGLVIGTELFVRSVMSNHPRLTQRRILPNINDNHPLVAWRSHQTA